MLASYGAPSKSREEQWLEFLGNKGASDLYTRTDFSIHFEYCLGSDRVKMITLMAPSAVPQSSEDE